MSSKYPHLFSPFQVGRLKLRNRFVVPPMLQCRSVVSPEGIAWYRRMASGGAGLVIVEVTSVRRFGTEITAKALAPLVKAIHDLGAGAAIQLFPVHFGEPTEPSLVPESEIKRIIDLYGKAAAVCKDAGFDAVEPHGAHGYLINQFFMPDRNHRTDSWGGSLENRGRLGVSIVRSIRKAIGNDMLLFYRHTPTGSAYTLEESVEFGARLVAEGVDVLDISPARQDTVADLAAPFKRRLPATPVIAVKGMSDPDAAEQALTQGRCDLVAVGRGMIADAQLPSKILTGHTVDIVRCTECNIGCFGQIKKREPVVCEQWHTDEIRPFLVESK